ncbi:MAG TPA: DUF2283 domain-containing protein [Planctomycetota bacterium]|nr:DUF2283 domain-containing protein [Planctomycetota bacterium]
MSQPYLEVTFRRGRAFAAYYHLTDRASGKSFKSHRIEPGLVVDYARTGEPIGIEITAPSAITLTALNRVLRNLGATPMKRAEFQPLRVAS